MYRTIDFSWGGCGRGELDIVAPPPAGEAGRRPQKASPGPQGPATPTTDSSRATACFLKGSVRRKWATRVLAKTSRRNWMKLGRLIEKNRFCGCTTNFSKIDSPVFYLFAVFCEKNRFFHFFRLKKFTKIRNWAQSFSKLPWIYIRIVPFRKKIQKNSSFKNLTLRRTPKKISSLFQTVFRL